MNKTIIITYVMAILHCNSLSFHDQNMTESNVSAVLILSHPTELKVVLKGNEVRVFSSQQKPLQTIKQQEQIMYAVIVPKNNPVFLYIQVGNYIEVRTQSAQNFQYEFTNRFPIKSTNVPIEIDSEGTLLAQAYSNQISISKFSNNGSGKSLKATIFPAAVIKMRFCNASKILIILTKSRFYAVQTQKQQVQTLFSSELNFTATALDVTDNCQFVVLGGSDGEVVGWTFIYALKEYFRRNQLIGSFVVDIKASEDGSEIGVIYESGETGLFRAVVNPVKNNYVNENTEQCVCGEGFVLSQGICIKLQDTQLKVSTTSDCRTGYIMVNFSCVLDCSPYLNSSGNNGADACSCVSPYDWNRSQCYINCSKIANTVGNHGRNGCACAASYYWKPEKCVCFSQDTTYDVSTDNTWIIGVVIGPVFIIVLLAVICIILRRRHRIEAQQRVRAQARAPNIEPFQAGPLQIISNNPIPSEARINFSQYPQRSYFPYHRPVAYQGTIPRVNERPNRIHSASPTNPSSFNQTCSICLESGPNARTQCDHMFHEACISLWRSSNNLCPNCRSVITNITVNR